MSDNEIKTIDLHSKSNPNFLEFVEGVNKLLMTKTAITTSLKPLTDKFAVLISKLEGCLVAVRGNSHTQALNEADAQRDMIHSGLIHLFHAYSHSGNEAKMAAAERMLFVAKQYGFGKLRRADHDTETALLDGLMETLRSDKYKDDIALLSEINNFLSALQDAMDNYKQVKSNKATEASTKLDYTARDVRNEIVPIYRKIVGTVEGMAEVGADPSYSEFIAELNGLIDIS